MLRVIEPGHADPWVLHSDQVHLWFLDPAVVADAAHADAVAVLAPMEAARHQQFRFARDRELYLATRLLVRTVLSRYCQVEPRSLQFGAGASGKPELTAPTLDPALRFNLSNSGGLVACAVTHGRDIGVDVEAMRDVPLSVAEEVFTPVELETLYEAPQGDRQRTLLALWTMKESFIKATGRGLSAPLRAFAVGLTPPRLLHHQTGISECARWQFARLSPTPSHTLAVCVAATEPCDIEVIPRWLSAAFYP